MLSEWTSGVWRWKLPHATTLMAGVTDRTGDVETIRRQVHAASGLTMAEQVHGASIAAIGVPGASDRLIAGCDALTTQLEDLVLIIRTADCLPLFLWDPVRRAIGLAHAGWRGLASQLPMRLMRRMSQCYHSRPEEVWVGIGPAIHACCYEVGEEFEQHFAPFIRRTAGRRTCDLIACATQQLLAVGIRRSRVSDCGQCTGCQTKRWYSVRREGDATGRLFSFMVMPSSPN